jgi:hypothetical protein
MPFNASVGSTRHAFFACLDVVHALLALALVVTLSIQIALDVISLFLDALGDVV